MEPGGNNKNGGKDFVPLCQPRGRYRYVHGSGDLITREDHMLTLLQLLFF